MGKFILQFAYQFQVIKTDYGKERPISVDGYFKKRQKKQDKLHLKKGEQADSNGNEYSVGHQTDKIKIRSYDDLMRVIQSDTSGYDMDEMVEDLSMGLAGWPGFRDVFTVSALFESGVKDLKEYLVSLLKTIFLETQFTRIILWYTRGHGKLRISR